VVGHRRIPLGEKAPRTLRIPAVNRLESPDRIARPSCGGVAPILQFCQRFHA
jgi:hypothetical protein